MADAEYERFQERRVRDQAARHQRIMDWSAKREREQTLRAKTKEERARFEREQAAQARRDARLNMYDVQGTNQRAGIAADAAYNQQGYTLQRDRQQQIDQLKRDAAQQGYTLQRDDRQFGQQMQRDAVQQGYGVQNDNRQFGQQLQRDAIQQGYGVQNDERQFGQQIQRDTMQDQFSTRRDRAQQQDLLQRDEMQFGQQILRDDRQQGYQAQRDERLQGYSEQDANRQFGFQQQRDERLQEYDTRNATQRETFDVSARWQDQIQQARNAGMDFSPKQQQEMKQLDEAFQKNVMHNPDLDEGLKQQAMLQHQRKLAAIVPNEKVVNPAETLNQSVIFHEPTNTWFKRGRGPQGHDDWEPLGSSGGGQQKEDPQIARQRDAMFKREDEFLKIRDKIASKVDPETGEPLYSDDEIDKLAMDEFAPKEAIYRREHGLPPQAKYQKEADIERQKMEQKQQRDLQRPSQYDVNRPQEANQQQQPVESDAVRAQRELQQRQEFLRRPTSPPAKPKPVTVSSTNIDDQLKQSLDGGDRETAAALQAVKQITANGVPDEGSPEFAELYDALRFLNAKGVQIDGAKRTRKQNSFENALGGWGQ